MLLVITSGQINHLQPINIMSSMSSTLLHFLHNQDQTKSDFSAQNFTWNSHCKPNVDLSAAENSPQSEKALTEENQEAWRDSAVLNFSFFFMKSVIWQLKKKQQWWAAQSLKTQHTHFVYLNTHTCLLLWIQWLVESTDVHISFLLKYFHTFSLEFIANI